MSLRQTYTPQVILIILFCTLFSMWSYVTYEFQPCLDCEHTINVAANRILAGEAAYPFKYRPLTPALLAMGDGGFNIFLFWHTIGRLALLTLVAAWAAHWRANVLAVITIATLTLSLMYPTWYNSDYNLTEAVFLLVGWLLIFRKQQNKFTISALLLLMVIASWNRETTAPILALNFAGVHYRKPRVWLTVMIIGFLSIMVPRVVIGLERSPFTAMDVFLLNMTAWRLLITIVLNGILALLYGAMLIRLRDQSHRYLFFIVSFLPYVGIILILGGWNEIRLQLPIILALFPCFTGNRNI